MEKTMPYFFKMKSKFVVIIITSLSLSFLTTRLTLAQNSDFFPPDSHLQFDQVEINTKFSKIIKIFGETDRFDFHENGDDYICYYSSAPDDDTLILFVTGAMGSWNNMIYYHLYNNKYDYPLFEKCASSNKISKDVKFGPNFYLGIKRNEIIKILGTPHNKNKFHIYYDFNAVRKKGEVKVKHFNKSLWLKGYFWVNTTMKFFFDENDRLIYVIMGKSEST